MPQRKPTLLPLPKGGEALGVVVRAFGVDVPDALAGHYFRGTSVSEKTRGEIFQRAAAGLIEALLPASNANVELARILTAALRVNAGRWDDVVGLLGAAARSPKDVDAVLPVFAMVVAVELAFRIGAAWQLAGVECAFSNPADLAALTEEKPGIWLRSLVADAGLTREELTERVGVADASTIDDWLDGRHRPSSDNLAHLATVLSTTGDQAHLLLTLRRYFGIWQLRGRLRDALGLENADGTLCHFAIYAGDAFAALGASDLPKPVRRRSEAEIASKGFDYAPTSHLVRHILRFEELPLWRGILRACAGNWFGFLRYALTMASELEKSTVAPGHLTDSLFMYLCDPLDPPPGADVNEWRTFLQSDPKLLAARLETRGEQLIAIDMLHDAVQSYRAALDLAPDSAVLHYRLGCALWQSPERDRSKTRTADHSADVREAEQELWAAHQLAADHNDPLTRQLALIELTWLLLEHDRRGEALALAESFKERFGALSAQAAYVLGWARADSGDLKGAIHAFEDALRKQPTHYLAHEALEGCRRAQRESRALKATIARRQK